MFEKYCTIVSRILNDLLYIPLVPYEIGSIIHLQPRDGLFLWGIAWRVLYVFAFVFGVVSNWRIFVCGQMYCFPSYVRPEAKLLRLAGEVARRAGGDSHPRCHSAWRTERPLWPPHGERNGHYGRRMVNGTAIMAAARRGESPFGLADSEIRVPGCEGSCVFSLKIKFF